MLLGPLAYLVEHRIRIAEGAVRNRYGPLMKFDTAYYKLANGVRVLTIAMQGVESVTALILAKTGSRNESVHQAGISHVLEHMVFKGTKSYPSPMDLASAVDGVGAEQNAFTSKEYTGYYITCAAKHLSLALDIQSEMVTVPLIPQVDLEREREVIVEEINMYEDHPMERAAEEFENLIYGGSSMGRLIIGTKETVRATSARSLKGYMKEWYRGGNMLVVVAGKLPANQVLTDMIQQQFGGIEKGNIAPYITTASYGKKQSYHLQKKTEQAHFLIGVPAISMDDPRRYSLQLGQVILGGGMSSRLFNEIREKRGLAYYVKADLDTSYDVGYLAVRAGVKLENLSEAMEVVRHELFRLADTLTELEVSRAKEYLLGRLTLSLEDSMGVAQFFGTRALILDKIRQPREVMSAVQRVTMKQVREVLKDLVAERHLRSVVVGPRDH